MKKLVTLLAVMTMFAFFSGTESLAQQGMMRGGGWGGGSSYGRMYNPQTVETINGEVISINKIKPVSGMSYGIHAVVKTEKETISVHLGPAWYIENQDVEIVPKETIEVKGSRITFEGKSAIIAAEIKKSDEIIVLRDINGFPAWSGWRRR